MAKASLPLTSLASFETLAAGYDHVVLSLSRREVESGNVAAAVDRLLNLSEHEAHLQRFENGLSLSFEGWDSDPRERHQIPELVAFFRKLNAHWPYWLHFVEKEGPTFDQVICLLCDIKGASKPSPYARFKIFDPAQFVQELQRMFRAMGELYTAYGIDDSRKASMTESVRAAFLRYTTEHEPSARLRLESPRGE